jgi:hypothetical protein
MDPPSYTALPLREWSSDHLWIRIIKDIWEAWERKQQQDT